MANRRGPNPAQIQAAGPPAPGQTTVPLAKPPTVGDPVAEPHTLAPHTLAPHTALIQKRQNTLLAHGYDVAVDGVWGNQSQQAWSHFVYWKNRGQPFHALGALPPQVRQGRLDLFGTPSQKAAYAKTVDQQAAPKVAIKAAKGAVKALTTGVAETANPPGSDPRIVAQAVADRKIQVEQQRVWDDQGIITKDPAAVSHWQLTRVVKALTDTSIQDGPTPQTAEGATALQYWLGSHGYRVKLTHTYDIQTHDALQKAFQAAEKVEHTEQVQNIIANLYQPYNLTVGQKAPWLPGFGGKVPTPNDLLSVLHNGGTEAATVEKALRARILSGEQTFDQLRNAELINLLARLQLEPGRDYIYPATGESAYETLMKLKLPGGSAADGRFQAEITALYTSKTAHEFRWRISQIAKLNEDAFRKDSGDWLSKTLHGFGSVASYALVPGNWLRRELVTGAMQADASGHYIANLTKDIFENPYGTSNQHELNAAMATGHFPNEADAQAWIDALPAYERIPFEMFVDPLNFFAPFKLGSTALRFAGFKAFGSYVLKEGVLEDAARGLRYSEGIVSKRFGLVYEKGTWSKLAIPKALDKTITGGRLAKTRPAQALDTLAKKATALKPDVIRKARQQAVISSRHLYTAPDEAALTKVKVIRGDAKVRQAARAGRDAVKAAILNNDRYRPVYETLLKAHASIYATADLSVHSSVGASIVARHAEEARIQVTHQLAQEVWDRVIYMNSKEVWDAEAKRLAQHHANAVADGDKAGARAASTSIRRHAALRDAGGHRLTTAEATKLANEEYEKVVNVISAHITGGTDLTASFREVQITESGATMVEKNVIAEIRNRQNAIMDQFETAILPAIHEMVQHSLVQGGKSLWDAEGKWIGRGALEQRILRDLGFDAFDPAKMLTVPNASYGLGFTQHEMNEQIADELARTTNRLHWRAARDKAYGDKASIELDQRIQAAEDDIISHWHKHSDGKWYDNRPTIDVPDFYARHLRESLTSMRPGHGPGLGEIAQGTGRSGPFEHAIGAITWDLGGRGQQFGYAHGAEPAGFVHDGSDASAFNSRQVERTSAEQLTVAVTKSMVALSSGYDHAVSQAFAKEGAIMLALAHAQSYPLRTIYRGATAATNTWVFVTLPLRPGWVFRNVADNTVKTVMAGIHDPRMFFQGYKNPRLADGVHSVFSANLAHVRSVTAFADKLFGTDYVQHFDHLLEHFWRLEETVLNSIFNAHAVEVNENVIKQMRHDPYAGPGERKPLVKFIKPDELQRIRDTDPALADQITKLQTPKGAETAVSRFRDTMWHLMGSMPEDYSKRVIYRATVKKTMEQLDKVGHLSEAEKQLIAMNKAAAEIEKHLFDYSKVTIAEDNLRAFMPFIQFWRKNTAFWATAAVNKPWLPLSVAKWEDERKHANQDWPEWMRRYVDGSELVDAAAVVPGLAPVVAAMLPKNMMTDPLNYTSFGKLYKIVKGENPNLPDDKVGWKLIGPLFDYLDSYGPGVSPLVRKPLENAGIANTRSWQTVFPQVSVAIAMNRDWWTTQHTGAEEWTRLFALHALGVSSDKIASDFDYYVNMEVVGQQARGEPVDRKKAEATIRKFFVMQNLVGYFTGVYGRRATPQDIYLSKMWEDLVFTHTLQWSDLTPEQSRLMAEWAKRHMNRQSFMEYVSLVPTIEAYFRQTSFDAAQRYKMLNPAIMQYIDPAYKGKPVDSLAKHVLMTVKTDDFFKISQLYSDLNVDFDVRHAATSALLTPDMKKSWGKNDTPKDRQRKMIQGEVHSMLKRESDTFFAIPEKDYAAKEQFLQAHPELARSWISNNSVADNFGTLLHDANAELRQQVFNLIDAKDYDGVDKFLKAHPYIWEDTKKAYEFDPKTGQKKLMYLHGKARATVEAKPQLDVFFKMIHDQGKKKAFAWLYGTQGHTQDVVRQYFRQWGKHKMDVETQTAFATYDRLPKSARAQWLNSGSHDAILVKRFWYSHETPSQRLNSDAVDYFFKLPASKRYLWLHGGSDKANRARRFLWNHQSKADHQVTLAINYFYSLPKGKRHAWQHSNDPRAKIVHDFFWQHESPAERQTSVALDYFFSLKKEDRQKWQHSDDPRAKLVHDFFWKHENKQQRTTSLAVDYFFNLPKSEQSHWLDNAFDPRAKLVEKFFAQNETVQQRMTRLAFEQWSKIAPENRNAWLNDGGPAAKLVLAALRKDETPKEKADRLAMEEYRKLKTSDARQKWLDSPTEQARSVRSQFNKLDLTRTHRAVDYMRIKPIITAWRQMSPPERKAFISDMHNEKAQALREYLDKYGRDADADQHALDYYEVKDVLAAYGKMDKDQRRVFLRGGSGDAVKLLDYFKKYSKTHQYEAAFYKAHPDLVNGTPEQAARLRFWKAYFALTPDLRPAFVDGNAEKAGVFIYGAFSEKEMADKAAEFHRMTGKLTDQQGAYLYAKPLIDFYYKLPKEQRGFFAQVNPEVSDYFDRFAKGKLTSDPKLNAELETYFKMPPYGNTRTTYLATHPEVSQYFDQHTNAQQKAIHTMLDFYFALPFDQRAQYADQHPELGAFFDRQKAQRDSYKLQTEAFDTHDPRLSPYFAHTQSLIDEAAFERAQLRQSGINALHPETIVEGHGDRQAYKAATGKHQDSRGSLKKLPKDWIQSSRVRRV